MPLFDWPTVSDIREDSSLRPEQLGKLVLSEGMLSDIAQKIQEAGPVVERRILATTSPEPWPFEESDLAIALPKYSEEQRAARQEGQISVARKGIALIALHFLFDRSGQLSGAYQNKANEYKADAEMLLTGSADGTGEAGLLGELKSLSEAIGAGVADNSDETVKLSFSIAPAKVDGYNTTEDEFARTSIWGRYC